MLEIGSVVEGKYKVLSVIGRGGMSTVYLAMNENANKQWAIKEVVKQRTPEFEMQYENLQNEIYILKQLKHKGIPSVVDVIEDVNRVLVVMDYIEGITLAAKLKEEGAQSQDKVIDWAMQLTDILSYLHNGEQKYIYRDLKPHNIIVKPDGTLTLIDFGATRIYRPSKVADTTSFGTKGYAAPEQFGKNIQTDERTDIYGLGATLHHLVTGHDPSEPPYEMLPIRQWNDSLSSGLEEILIKCLQSDPRQRYKTCEEVRYALEHYNELDNEYKIQQKKRLRRFVFCAASSVICFVLSIIMAFSERSFRDNTYEVLTREAKLEVQPEDAIAKYAEAIRLDPDRGAGYVELLEDLILSDDILSEQEAVALRDILNYNDGSGRTNEEYFMQNQEAYERFSYRLGVAYFYSYEDVGNKSLARKWLKIASTASTLAENQIERAKRLGKISDYYAKSSMGDTLDEMQVDYREYWDDLLRVTDGNLVLMDNATTAVIIYSEMVYQIYTNCKEFHDVGIARQALEGELERIAKHLDEDFETLDEEHRQSFEERIQRLRQNMDMAKQTIEATYAMDEMLGEE